MLASCESWQIALPSSPDQNLVEVLAYVGLLLNPCRLRCPDLVQNLVEVIAFVDLPADVLP